jgi:serine phosphatase RsbU (regulator of sigma subunit)
MKFVFLSKVFLITLLLCFDNDLYCQSAEDSLLLVLKEAKHDTDKAKTLYNLSKLYNDSDPNKGIDYLKKAYDISIRTNNLRIQSDITNQIGYNYYFLSDFNHSVEFFLKTLVICEKQGNKSGISGCHNNIGSIYLELEDTVNALHHHLLALKMRKENSRNDESSKNEIAMSYGNVGKTYFTMRNYSKAMEYYNLCLDISREVGNKKREALMLNNIGSIFAEQKKYDEALPYYTNAFSLYKEIDSQENIALCLNNIAEIYYRKKDFLKSIENYKASLAISEQNSTLSDMKSSYDGLHNCYLQLNDFKLAHDYLAKYVEIKDSIFNEENSSQINELLAKFDSDKKEQEITLLQKDKEMSVWLRNSLIVGSLLLVFLAFSLYSRNRVKQKANLELSLKNKNIEEQKQIVEHQKMSLEVHQKEIVDSINYARRIQYALLANSKLIDKYLPEHFVLFKPKDIVSGDFYWATEHNGKFYVAACDCTGHGVPGAFMSLLNIGFLSEAIKEKNIVEPNEIFNYVRTRLIESIGQEEQQDGMDGILICFDVQPNINAVDSLKISYAASNNGPVLVKSNDIKLLPKDKMPVGKGERMNSFSLFSIDLQKGDSFYLYTDGYADQFGGEKGKKFKHKSLNQLLEEVNPLPLVKQHDVLTRTFDSWKGNLEQVDDVLIIGIKI